MTRDPAARLLSSPGAWRGGGPLSSEPILPGRGYPSNPGEDRPGLSPFGRLAKKQGRGKSSVLRYNGLASGVQPAETPMVQLEGDDLDACQLVVTLAAPRVIPIEFADVISAQLSALTGEESNAEVADLVDFPGDNAPIQWPPLEAIVEWGVGGTQARATVDFINGTTFSVVASFVRVHGVISQSLASGDISGTSAAYYLAGFVGPGWTEGKAQRTIYVGIVSDSTDSDVFDVPKFARRVTVVGCDDATPPALSAGFIRFYQSPNGAPGNTNVGNFFFNGNQPLPFDIPNAAQYFQIFNQSGVAMKCSAIFELALS